MMRRFMLSCNTAIFAVIFVIHLYPLAFNWGELSRHQREMKAIIATGVGGVTLANLWILVENMD